jgi:hypothetical protein
MRAFAAPGRTGLRRCTAVPIMLLLAGGWSLLSHTAAASAADLTATPSTLASVFSSAQPGDRILLAAGTYSFSGGTKSGTVTLTPQSGAAVTMSLSFAGSSGIAIDGVTVKSMNTSNKAHDITVRNSDFTGQTYMNLVGAVNSNIVLDSNTIEPWSAGNGDAEGRVHLSQPNALGTQPVGVTVSNNYFKGPGCSDGIQIGSYGVVVKNNVFDGIKQGSCAPHVDSIQFYGQSHTVVTGNYFTNFSTAIMAPDGGNGETITNNVFDNGAGNSASAIQMGAFSNGSLFAHNTVRGTDVDADGKSITMRDNAMVDAHFSIIGCSGTDVCTINHNLYNKSGQGTSSVVGVPTWTGGTNPTTYGGWALAPGSPGKANASDGSDRGMNVNGSTAPPTTDPPPADTTAPDTNIDSGPSGTTSDSTPTFAFSATETGSTFQCKVDSSSWSSCTNPKTTATLADGSHTFSVRATDAAGNVDASPATRTFTVSTAPPADTTAPDTNIDSGPSGTTSDSTPTFAFSATETGSTFQCKVDSGAWASCTSPKTTATLADGNHTFSVRATDAAGNTDASSATRTFTVSTAPPPDTTAPDTTIAGGLSGLTKDATPTFTFSSSESGSTFQCRIDLGSWMSCSSPYTAATLTDGNHTFAARATDQAGNTDASAASRALTVDSKAPKTTITRSPLPLALGDSATVAFAADDPAATFECEFDGGAWMPCTSPAVFTGLTLGAHKLVVRGTDAAGNVEAARSSASWTTVAVPGTTMPEDAGPPTSSDPSPTEPAPGTPAPGLPATPPQDTSPSVPATPPPAPSAPTIALLRPQTGSRFISTLTSAALATDADGIARVEFWLDGLRIGVDRRAPYTTRWTVSRSVGYGQHTLTVRAFDRTGAVSSAAVAVTRGRGGATSAKQAAARWLVSSLSVGDAATQLGGASRAGDTVTITYTRCDDAKGRPIGIRRVRTDAHGALRGTLPASGACVLKVS